MPAPTGLARTAGLYYFVVAVLGAFAQIVRTQVHVPGDALTTAANVVAHAELVRAGVVADLVQATFFLFVALTLFRLLRHVDEAAARTMVTCVVIAVAIICLNLVPQLGALLVATDTAYTAAFSDQEGATLVLLLLDLQHWGSLVAQIFFGLWLFPLGRLAMRSRMFPRPLAGVLLTASVLYVVDVALQLLAPGLAHAMNPALIAVVTLSEGWLLVYLLVRGIRTAPVVERAAVAV